MDFNGESATHLTSDEVAGLIGVPEDESLEYKREPWPDTRDGLFELLHDITGIATGEGGYIIIGAISNKRQGRDELKAFQNVKDAARVTQRIRSHVHQRVDSRIEGFEVEFLAIDWKGRTLDLVVIRIPPSPSRPHGFDWNDSTIFVRRYHADVRAMPVSELGQMFATRYFPETETSKTLQRLIKEIAMAFCRSEGIKPRWTSWSGNTAACNLARKLGFAEESSHEWAFVKPKKQ